MPNFFAKTIKARLYGVALLIVIAVLTFAALYQWSFRQLELLDSTSVTVLRSQTSILMLRRHEKDFMARVDTKYQDKFNREYKVLIEDLNKVGQNLNALGIENSLEVSEMLALLKQYQSDFSELVDFRLRSGADHQTGLKGSAREAAHLVERYIQAVSNDELYSMMLTLRRNEKDFLLRADDAYATKFNANFQTLQLTVKNTDLSPELYASLAASMETYHKRINELIATMKTIGLSPAEGLHGSLRSSVQKVEKQMSRLSTGLLGTIEAKEQSVGLQLAIYGGVMSVALSLLLLIIARSVSNRVSSASNLMTKIAKGDTNLQVKMEIAGSDELATLANAFNTFIGKLHTTIEQVASISSRLAESANHSYTLAGDTQSDANRQQSESESVSTSVNEMTMTSREIAESVSRAALAAEQLQESAQTGRNVNRQTSEQAGRLSESMQGASNLIQKLSVDSEQIGSVIGVIRSITEQTNLLALNAAIEAARAGDQGRGFAVVADQVRELAMKTHTSTDEITGIIEKIQSGIQISVEVMTESSELAEESVEQTGKAAEAIENMITHIEDIAGQNLQIATASEEQTVVTESVDQNITVIAELAQRTSEAADKSTNAAQHIQQLSTDLDGLIVSFRS